MMNPLDTTQETMAILRAASESILNGQPFEAYTILKNNSLLETDLGKELVKQLPLYEEVESDLNQMVEHIGQKEYQQAHDISRRLPDLIYPEAVEIQRLSVAILMEDDVAMETFMNRLPDNQPYVLQIRSLLHSSTPVQKNTKKQWGVLAGAAGLTLAAGIFGLVAMNQENTTNAELKTMTAQRDEIQSQVKQTKSDVKQAEQRLAATQKELSAREKKWETERKELESQLDRNQSTASDVGGLTAYANGDYEKAVSLLSKMKPAGLYNQETIDFYKLMAGYKIQNESKQALNEFETSYPDSDYLGDAYFAYLTTLKNQEEYDKTKEEMKVRFAGDWFIPAM